jgi:hypothetical protein
LRIESAGLRDQQSAIRNERVQAFFKNFAIAGERRIQLRAEAFNITNHVNFGLPQMTVFNSSGLVSNAGQITNIVGTARQWQFGVKVDF